jgi:hypothetical protein
MLPRYSLDLIRDSADELTYEESANYGDAFTCFVIGISFLAFAVVLNHGGPGDLSRRKLLASLFLGGFCFCCFAVPYLVTSRITLNRDQMILVVRRSLFGVTWTHQYRIDDIEEIFDGTGARGGNRKQLGLELTNGRTKRLTLWAKRTSLSAEETHLNEVLHQIRKHAERQTGRTHKPVTEDEWWAHTHENAQADLNRHMKRTVYALVGTVATSGAVVPFLKGYPLHRYWTSGGTILLFAALVGWIALILEAAFSYISWRYVADLKKIDKE